MRHLMPLLAAAALVLSTAPAYADLGDQLFKLLPDDCAAEDVFGSSVAISGNTAIVGTPNDDDNGAASGSACLFGTTTGQQLLKLLPNDGATGDEFGYSVAISGDTAIVGAYRDDDNGIDSGSAYLFDTTTGQQVAKLLPDDGENAAWFGYSVAISGTTVIVGAAVSGVSSGSAYLFDTTTGRQIAKLLPTDSEAGLFFGGSVAISGANALVGAPLDGDNGRISGSAYLFDTTTGTQIAKLLPDDGAAGDRFGDSVAINGTIALVSAYGNHNNGLGDGSAYLFDTTTGQQVAKLLPDDGPNADKFGYSVAISGTTVIVGAFGSDDACPEGSLCESGSAYLFDVTDPENPVQLYKLTADDAAEGDRFGHSVAISGTTAILGASGDDDNGDTSGSAYLFDTASVAACPWDCDGDGVADDVDECPGETGTAANNGCPEIDDTQQLCGSGVCNPGGASLALLFGLLLMRFGYRRPTRRA